MFGYVTINKSELSEAEYERFRSYYCGLCRVLKKKYKRRGQAVLTYDMTFLVILLTSLYECESEQINVHCIPNGVKSHEVLVNEMTEYAADMNLALAYHKCMDNWKDEHAVAEKVVADLLKSRYDGIRARYPRQCSVIEKELDELSRLEGTKHSEPQKEEQDDTERQECWKERAKHSVRTAPQNGDADVDSAANCFGRLTAEIFVYREDEWRETLWQIGFLLGKFIYLMDAYDDLQKDLRKGNYNPLSAIAGKENFEEFCRQMLVMTMADCSKKFEQLPLLQEVGILRNVIYSGVWTKYNLLQNKKKSEKREK